MDAINDLLNVGTQAGGPVILILAISNWIKGWIPEKFKSDDRFLPLIPIAAGIGYSILYGEGGFSLEAVTEGFRHGMMAIATFVGGKKLTGHSKWEPSRTMKKGVTSSETPTPPK